MTLCNSRFAFFRIRPRFRWSYHSILFIGSLDEIKPLIFFVESSTFDNNFTNWSPRQIMKCLLWLSSFDAFVRCIKFSPCLLQQNNPKFILVRWWKGRLVLSPGHILIHINSNPLPFKQQLHEKISMLINLLQQEQIVNSVWALRKSSQAC